MSITLGRGAHFRVKKQIPISRASIGLFFDMFNTFNSNTAVNLVWQSVATNNRLERASTVLGPRIAKFGVKFDW